ncbi:hypothetical protein AAIH25_01760 [Arthrobacter crystallopoietes]|uniref:hypothetical protein n=1 Tax=Crystallibacter crystallopoietes TaxID=37928 RepID=UPI003D1B53D7
MTDPAVTNRDGVGEAVAGPFTMRDITVALAVVLLFLASVLPAGVFRGIVFNIWNSAGLFQLGLSILLPVIVLVLFAIRRLAPKTKLRIGSLSVDQFASVVACFNAAYYFLELVSGLQPVSIIGFVGGLGLLAATVCARWIPQFRADFVGRPETTAHPVARDAIEPRPKTAKPKAATAPAARADQAAAAGGASAGAAAADAAGGPAGHNALASAAEGSRPGAGDRQGSTAVPTKSESKAASGSSPAAGSKAAAAVAGAAGAAAAGAGSAASAGTPGTGATGAATGAAAGAGTARPSGSSGLSGTSGAGAAGRTGETHRVTAPTGPAAKTSAAGADDEAAPGAADGEAVGIPVSDDEAVASAAGRSARQGSAAASAAAAKEATPPAELGAKTEANSIAGAGSRGPDAAKGQPDAALSAAGATGRTAPETDRAPQEQDRAEREERAEEATASYPKTAAMGSVAAGNRTASAGPISATREHYEEPEEDVTYEAFWFAVGRTRPVFDENTGQVAFTLEPGAWILALQDRDDEFLVQHTDGRVGVLRDLTNIERA